MKKWAIFDCHSGETVCRLWLPERFASELALIMTWIRGWQYDYCLALRESDSWC